MKLEKFSKLSINIYCRKSRNINLKGISTDSREIKDNFLFGAIKGKI